MGRIIRKTATGLMFVSPKGEVLFTNKDHDDHRLKGPARIFPDGGIVYKVRRMLHREDGPAIVYGDIKHYYIKNVSMYESAYFMKYGAL